MQAESLQAGVYQDRHCQGKDGVEVQGTVEFGEDGAAGAERAQASGGGGVHHEVRSGYLRNTGRQTSYNRTSWTPRNILQ